jgi:hypothetical protein
VGYSNLLIHPLQSLCCKIQIASFQEEKVKFQPNFAGLFWMKDFHIPVVLKKLVFYSEILLPWQPKEKVEYNCHVTSFVLL